MFQKATYCQPQEGASVAHQLPWTILAMPENGDQSKYSLQNYNNTIGLDEIEFYVIQVQQDYSQDYSPSRNCYQQKIPKMK